MKLFIIILIFSVMKIDSFFLLCHDNEIKPNEKGFYLRRAYKNVMLKKISEKISVKTKTATIFQRNLVWKKTLINTPFHVTKNYCAEKAEEKDMTMKCYPIPAVETVTFDIQFDASYIAQLKVYSIEGKEMISKDVNIHQGNNRFSIDISNLSTGHYNTILSYNTNRIFGKFTKF
jgi:hypothetical protein